MSRLDPKVKARYWCAITYVENMRDGWQDDAEELLRGYPFAYCIHDKDNGHKGDRKDHVHWLLAYGAPTTRKTVDELFANLSAEGRKCNIPAEPAGNMAWAYDYLIHDTDNAKRKKKHLYEKSERIEGNNFDIGAYIQVSQQEKDEMLREILDFIDDSNFLDLKEFYKAFKEQFDQKRYFEIYKGYNAIVDRQIRGNYNARERKRSEQKNRCMICGSRDDLVGTEWLDGSVMWTCEKHKPLAMALVDEQMQRYFEDEVYSNGKVFNTETGEVFNTGTEGNNEC